MVLIDMWVAISNQPLLLGGSGQSGSFVLGDKPFISGMDNLAASAGNDVVVGAGIMTRD